MSLILQKLSLPNNCVRFSEGVMDVLKIKLFFSKYFYPNALLWSSALVVGLVTGAITAIFGIGLLWIGDFRTEHFSYLIPFFAFAGLAMIFAYRKWGKGSEKGMSLIFDATNNEKEKVPLQLIPLVFFSTWLTHLFGGSAGREGVAVQLGATVANNFSRLKPFKNISNFSQILTLSGIAAGFAGLFHTPIAAVLFALEVTHQGKLRYEAFIPSILAAVMSFYISCKLGLGTFTFSVQETLAVQDYWKLCVLGIAFGVIGGIFALLLRLGKKYSAQWLKNPYLRIAVIGVLLSVLLFLLHHGRYSGLGTNLIDIALNGEKVYGYDFILKLLLTVITLSAGYQGGEVTPLFAIGATLGAVLASVLGIPVALGAALGYAAVFGSATNTLLAPIAIGAEVFGFSIMPYFIIVVAISWIVNGNKSIYGKQVDSSHLWLINSSFNISTSK